MDKERSRKFDEMIEKALEEHDKVADKIAEQTGVKRLVYKKAIDKPPQKR